MRWPVSFWVPRWRRTCGWWQPSAPGPSEGDTLRSEVGSGWDEDSDAGYNIHTRSHTVLKFGKSPTGDDVSTGNGRNGFIITEGPVAPTRPGNAPPTALHPLPGNRESLNDWFQIHWGDWKVCCHWVAEQVRNNISGFIDCRLTNFIKLFFVL